MAQPSADELTRIVREVAWSLNRGISEHMLLLKMPCEPAEREQHLGALAALRTVQHAMAEQMVREQLRREPSAYDRPAVREVATA